MGLFNDTQDMEFLYTWALLPQAVYPTDLRSRDHCPRRRGRLRHHPHEEGRRVQLHRVRGLRRCTTPRAATSTASKTVGCAYTRNLKSRDIGADLRWNTPVDGLTVGYSRLAARRPTSEIQMPVKLPFGR